jgi:predicted HTH domain antitoxin
MRSVVFDLPHDVTDEEARLLVAIGLYEQKRVSIGKAAQIAGYSRRAFTEILSHRGIAVVDYPAEDLAKDLEVA